jgi:thiol-disulfide isomerase/thioredoxin
MKANLFDRSFDMRRLSASSNRFSPAPRGGWTVCVVLALVATAAWTTGALALKPPPKPGPNDTVKKVPVETQKGTAYKLVPVTEQEGQSAKSATAPNTAEQRAPAEGKTPPAPTPAAAPVPAGGRATIKAVDPVKEFGTIWAGPVLEHSFTIKNEGNAPLEITKIKPSCGCTIAGKYPQKLEPGESGEFPFKLVSSTLRGKFDKSITITSNDPEKADLQLSMRGEVKQYVEVAPTQVDFGELYGTEPKKQVVRLTSNSDTPLKLEVSTPPGDNFDVNLVETTPGKVYELQVTAKPPFDQPERIRKTIALKTNIEAAKSIEIPVRAAIPQRLEVQPSQLTLGSVKGLPQMTEKGLTRVISFDNYGAKPTKLLEAKADDPEISVKIDPRVEGRKYAVQVQFPPGYNVPATGRTITLKTDDAEKPTITIPVKGQAQPTTAAAPATPPKRPAEEMVGQPAPAFAGKTTAGKSFANADIKDAVTVVDFFAVNCGYCGKQIPKVETIRKQFADAGVRFVAVSQTMGQKFTEQETTDKIKELGFHGELVVDSDNAIGPLFKANSYPTMVVIGKTGKIEAVNIGAMPDLETRLQGQLGALIAGKPVPTTFEATAAKPEAPKPDAQPPTPQRQEPDALVGKPAPAFAVATIEGKPVSNAQLAAHPATVLNIFAPNCGFCKKQIPRLEKIRAEYAEKGVRFVNVSQTMGKKFTTDEVVAVMKEIGSGFELAYEPDNKIGGLFNASGFPTMIVLGKSGNVEATNIGNLGDLEDRVKGQLDALIAGKPLPKTETAAAKPPTPTKRPAEEMAGQVAPAFNLTMIDGKTLNNADFAKHPATVLNIFAPDCGFCKKQIPNVEKVRAEYEAKGVRFVNVAQKMRTDFTPEDIQNVVKGAGANLELAISDFPANQVGQAFKAQSFPTMFVVDKNGKIAHVNIGAKPDIETVLKGQLDALIAGKAEAPKTP